MNCLKFDPESDVLELRRLRVAERRSDQEPKCGRLPCGGIYASKLKTGGAWRGSKMISPFSSLGVSALVILSGERGEGQD